MTRTLNRRTVGTAVALAVAAVFAFQGQAKADCGTAVDFVDSPAEAARLALKKEKLVFVLHVSGHFETPDFT
jgi:hypothetical protein